VEEEEEEWEEEDDLFHPESLVLPSSAHEEEYSEWADMDEAEIRHFMRDPGSGLEDSDSMVLARTRNVSVQVGSRGRPRPASESGDDSYDFLSDW
jgi:hypothetical protein